MWSALYLASQILPKRCFFKNQFHPNFWWLPLKCYKSKVCFFAMNNSPACSFVSLALSTHHESAPDPLEWSAPIRNQATFAATPVIHRPSMGYRGFTWVSQWILVKAIIFLEVPFIKQNGIIDTHCEPGVWNPPKDTHIFFAKERFPDSRLSEQYVKVQCKGIHTPKSACHKVLSCPSIWLEILGEKNHHQKITTTQNRQQFTRWLLQVFTSFFPIQGLIISKFFSGGIALKGPKDRILFRSWLGPRV